MLRRKLLGEETPASLLKAAGEMMVLPRIL